MIKLKHLLLKLILFISIIYFIIELGLRINGANYTYSEIFYGKYHSEYGLRYENWYRGVEEAYTIKYSTEEFNYASQTNKYGFREQEVNPFDSSKNKIFFLGDSFTEGVGAPTDSTLVKQVANRFNKDSISAMVYNFGRQGNDPFYYYTTLRDYVLQYTPSHVAFVLHLNDVDDVLMRGGFERFKSDGTTIHAKGPWFHFFYKHSHLVRLFIHKVFKYDWTLVQSKERVYKELEAKKLINDCLQKTDSLCNKHNIEFIAISFVDPWDHCYNNQADSFDLNNFIDSNTVNYNLIQIDQHMIQAKNTGDCKDISWPKDHHYNSKGYTILGDCIYEKIKPFVN